MATTDTGDITGNVQRQTTSRRNQKKLQLFAFTGLEHKFKPKLESADKSRFFFAYI